MFVLVANHSTRIFLPRKISLLIGVEGMMIPPVGEQRAADIQKQRRDRDRSLHITSVNAGYHL